MVFLLIVIFLIKVIIIGANKNESKIKDEETILRPKKKKDIAKIGDLFKKVNTNEINIDNIINQVEKDVDFDKVK